jgi:hypothetical protein
MKFLILHGTYGSNDSNWFPWLKSELEKLGQEVILPQMPVDDYDAAHEAFEKKQDWKPQHQTPENWLELFQSDLYDQIDHGEVCIISHSLAPVFVMHVLEKYQLGLDSAIFVAPFNIKGYDLPEYDVINNPFMKDDFDYELIKSRLGKAYVLHSDNDPYVPTQYSLDFAKAINASTIEVKGGEHMGSIYKRFPLVLELCKTRINLILPE